MKISSNVLIDEKKWIEYLNTLFKENEDDVYINLKITDEEYIVNTSNIYNNIEFRYKKMFENQEDIMMKASLLILYNQKLPWGSLVGVRPSKLVRKLLNNFNFEQIYEILTKIYLVSDKKSKLLIEVVKNSIKYLDNDTVGIYIGLAFCPTKCTYCSFPAYLKKGKYAIRYDEYFNTLLTEIKEIGNLCKELNLNINSIYIGGGTPSFLEENELVTMLETINQNFNLSNIKEYTFEAGRIDTITYEKLNILKKYLITRISINPQSFKEKTLKLVNRYHNIEKLNEVYNLSKKLNFQINMDYIIALPLETTEDILYTIEKSKEYDVENITFHYLALKNASNLNKSRNYYEMNLDYERIENEINKAMKEKNLHPYYMYRQKNSSQYGENMGYSKKGYENIYNIEMIEENKTIISIGAGAITKLIKNDIIKRIINPKDPLMWIDEFEERLIEKKKQIRELYEKD